MGDYIDRDAFVDDVKTEIINLSMDGLKGTRMPHDELYGFIERIKSQPAADVAPVVHGRWVVVEPEYLHCSVCGEAMYTGCNSTKEATVLRGHWKRYCPNCGAKMDKEE